MDLSVEEFIDGLLTKEALEKPSDNVNPDKLESHLPKWFDEEKFNRGRRFFWNNCFGMVINMILGLVSVFAVPTILSVLVGSKRSSSVFTAFKRYVSTMLHVISWFETELKPGTKSWKSLYTVRSRHLRSGLASKLKGGGTISQRDLALTQFGFIGYSLLKPDLFGVRQLKEGDWDAYLFTWRTIGHMIGIEDRYNICRKTVDETRQVCQILLDRVYIPCLENAPENFEHMSHVMLEGMWFSNPSYDESTVMYWTRYVAGVPGYIYNEQDRFALQDKLKEKLKGKPLDSGVDTRELMAKPAVDGLPDLPPRLLYLRDFDTLETVPAYKRLSGLAKYKMAVAAIVPAFYATYIGRIILNFNFHIVQYSIKYFPYLAVLRFGMKQAYVDMFAESPHDETVPIPNSEYYKKKPTPWYLTWFGIFTIGLALSCIFCMV